MKTLCELFMEQASNAPQRLCVYNRGHDFTYGQVANQADAFGAWLVEIGLQRGDRVAILLPNSPEYVGCYLGILRAGAIAVALNPDTTSSELAGTLSHSSPVVVIVGSKAAAPLAEAAPRLGSIRAIVHAGVEKEVGNLLPARPEGWFAQEVPDPFFQPADSLAPPGESTGVRGDQASLLSVFPSSWQVRPLREIVALDKGVGNLLLERPERCCALNVPDPVFQTCSAPWPSLDDLAQIIYTSGTTGRPKGVTLSHRNIAANCQSILAYLGLTAEDSILVALPFFYSYGNSLLFTHLAIGGRLVLASDFVFWNRVLDLMQEQRVTGFSGVPSSYAMLLHKSDFHKRSFPDLRYLTCAGGGLAPAVVERLRELVPHVRLFPMYGQTEATARLSTLMPEEIDAQLGSIGRGIPGVKLQVLDDDGRPVKPGVEGEIVAKGENIMVGYWNDSEETDRVVRPEGLRTGDLARVDEDGFIFIVGRKSDIIKSGAYRLNPKEIEELILRLKGVAEVAVVGLPDPMLGESPVAFIVPSPNGRALTEDDVIDHCRSHLPRYKQIRAVRFVTALPKTSSGKIKRTEIRESALNEQTK